MITLQDVQNAEELCFLMAATALGLSIASLSSEGNSSSANLAGGSGSGPGGEIYGFRRLGGLTMAGENDKSTNAYDASRIPNNLVGNSCNTICRQMGNTSCMWTKINNDTISPIVGLLATSGAYQMLLPKGGFVEEVVQTYNTEVLERRVKTTTNILNRMPCTVPTTEFMQCLCTGRELGTAYKIGA